MCFQSVSFSFLNADYIYTNFDVRNYLTKYQRRLVQNVRSLDVLEKSNLLSVPRVNPKETWKTFLVPELRLEDPGHFVCCLELLHN